MRHIFLTFLACLLTLTASAEDFKLTKCKGVVGKTGYGVKYYPEVSAAVQFTAGETAQYLGGKLSSVRFHISSTEYIGTLEMWIKNNAGDTDKLFSQVIASPIVGWNEVALDTPIEITGNMPIALGYTYTANGGDPMPVSMSDVLTEGGLLFDFGTGFIDCIQWPSLYRNLCMEATITDLSLDYAAEVISLSLDSAYYAPGKNAVASIEYQNRGKTSSSVELTLTCGSTVKTKTISGTLGNNQTRKTTITFKTPTEINGTYNVQVAVSAVDGEQYQGTPMSATFGVLKNSYPRTVLIEEGTGTWCGWCVRGIVAMEDMKAKYPDSFVGIAVHGNDAMQLDEYADNIGFSAFPGCTVDRRPNLFAVGVSPSSFESYYATERGRGTFADFTLEAAMHDGRIEASTSASFDFDAAAIDLRMVYVLLEDGVTGYSQKNYYSGGGSGAMGGFENKPGTVTDIEFNEVARAIMPNYHGEEGSFVSSIEKGRTYTNTLRCGIPASVQRADNLSLVAIMIEGLTGQVVQTHKVKLQDLDAVEGIAADDTPGQWYRMDGSAVATVRPSAPGIYICNGRKVVVK